MNLRNKTDKKRYFFLIISLLIFPSVFTITNLREVNFLDEDNIADEVIDDDELYEEPLYIEEQINNGQSFDIGRDLLDKTEEEIVESTYDREAFEWRPIEETLKNVQIDNELEKGTIANAEYNPLTGIETLSNPQFIPTAETASENTPGLRVVEPYAGLLADANGGTESVIGGDGRAIVNNNAYPYRTVVKLYIATSWGGNWVGSGAIIDDFHVLTAGHCAYIFDDDTGNEGWASSIEVVPGMDLNDNPSDPYGSAWVTGMRSYTGWTNSESSSQDWAVLTLDRNIGSYTGWMGRTTAPSSSSIYDGIMNVAGYPADLSSGNRMYWDSDSGDSASTNNHFYWADTAGGMSGGPVWRYASGNRHIMTIHAYGRDGADSNFGTRLNNDKYDRIFTWLGSDSAPTDKPDMVDRGPAYSSVSSTSVTAGVSSLTVSSQVRNVGTASTGGFYVHYYASTNDYISTYDYLLGSDYVSSVSAFNSGSASWSGTVPASIPEGNYYIGWIIDKDDIRDEFDETNNVAWEQIIHIDGVPPPISYIEVTVRDSVTYNYLSSAYVRVLDYGTSTVVDTGYTDINGFYNVTGLDIGEYTVEVSKVGYYGDSKYNMIHSSVVLSQGYDDDYLYFYLVEKPFDSGYIEVTVRDSGTSSLLPSAKVELLNFTTGDVISYGYTDSNGFFNITGLWVGWYDVRVSRYGYSTQEKSDYINWNGDDDYLTFYLNEMPFDSGYIEILVFNDTGGPVENAVVKTYNSTSGLLIDTGYTDVNGSYNITGLTIGWYAVNVSMLTFYGQEKNDYINWFGDDDYLTFYLTSLPPDSGFIEVYAYDNTTHIPLFNAYVQAVNQSTGDVIDSGYTDSSGYYSIENLTIGWYEINVTMGGYETQENQTYINYAGDYDELNFYLVSKPPKSGYIEVEVLDNATSLGLLNATVDCYYLNGTLFDSGYTDSSGFYNITGLDIGWYKVEVSKNAYKGKYIYDLINWNGDYDYLTFDLSISPPGYIIVQVFDFYLNLPIANAYIACFNTSSGILFDSGYADSNGYYNVSGLLPGWWTVNVSHVAFSVQSKTKHIEFLGDVAFLNFTLDTKFEPITGPVALFRDRVPWDKNMTEPILVNYSIPYTVYNSTDFGSVNLDPYQKVIIASDQTTNFYDLLAGNASWFESYMSNGGILLLSVCDEGWGSGDWNESLLWPGGLNKTEAFTNNVTFSLMGHPVLLNPFGIEDDELDSWGWSAHANFNTSLLPIGTINILKDGATGSPILIERSYGSGYVIATGQTIEWNQYYNYTKLLVNLVLYNPEFYNPTINVTSPTSSNTWEISNSYHTTWDTTGSTNRIKLDLYKDGAFVMEITPSTLNDGDYLWMVPPGLSNSSTYKIRVYDADWPTVYDDSDPFDIQDPRTITVVSPSSGSWAKGSTYSINWTTTGTIAEVTIDLYASGLLLLDISNGTTPNDGGFTWTIPTTLENYTDHIIRVTDASDPAMYDDSVVFQIIISPSGIPGYDFIILFGALVGVSFIVIQIKRKKLSIHKN